MTGTSRWPRLIIACNDGKIFLWARSPVAPKKTNASEWGTFMSCSSFGGFFQVAPETKAHRRKQFVLVICLAARSEPFVQCGCYYRHGHPFLVGCLDRPRSFP